MPDLLALESYDYDLPPELIAQHPLPERSASRLMHLRRSTGSITHSHFPVITDLLSEGDVLVMNNSRVIPARLYGTKDNGTRIEVLLLHNIQGQSWQCMVHPGKRLKHPQYIRFADTMRGYISEPDQDGLREIEFECVGDFWDELDSIGHIPLPPYIHRKDESEDKDRYQTVYAQERGSVAAPTAGLHFSPEILSQLRDKGVLTYFVTLHVGMGTFLPVKTERIEQHKMHGEFCTISPDCANAVNTAKAKGHKVVAVGSTSARTLESFYQDGSLQSGSKWTSIFIYPGKVMHAVDAMITNFHLPKSSLLMMISAFAGYELVRKAYREAVVERYRFFSYGDAMFID